MGPFNNCVTLKLPFFDPPTLHHHASSRIITRPPSHYVTPDRDTPVYHLIEHLVTLLPEFPDSRYAPFYLLCRFSQYNLYVYVSNKENNLVNFSGYTFINEDIVIWCWIWSSSKSFPIYKIFFSIFFISKTNYCFFRSILWWT